MPSNKSFKQPAKNCHAVNLWNIQLKTVIYLSNTCARYNFQTLLRFFSFFFSLWQHFEHDFKSCVVEDWFPSERKYPAGDDLNRTTSYTWKHVQWSTFWSMQITSTRWNTTSNYTFASHACDQPPRTTLDCTRQRCNPLNYDSCQVYECLWHTENASWPDFLNQ